MSNTQLTIEQIHEIILAEKDYWAKAPDVISIGAVGACSNILAAIYGFRAPWHPQVQLTPKEGNDERRD